MPAPLVKGLATRRRAEQPTRYSTNPLAPTKALVNGIDWAANGQLALIPGASPLFDLDGSLGESGQVQAFR